MMHINLAVSVFGIATRVHRSSIIDRVAIVLEYLQLKLCQIYPHCSFPALVLNSLRCLITDMDEDEYFVSCSNTGSYDPTVTLTLFTDVAFKLGPVIWWLFQHTVCGLFYLYSFSQAILSSSLVHVGWLAICIIWCSYDNRSHGGKVTGHLK